MPALRDDIDPQGLLEHSVVYTDRALNHMSAEFQSVMRDLSATLKELIMPTVWLSSPVLARQAWKRSPVSLPRIKM